MATGYTTPIMRLSPPEIALSRLAPEDRASQRAGLIMAAIYRTLLEEIEREGFRVLKEKTSLTPLRKLYIAWKTWIAA